MGVVDDNEQASIEVIDRAVLRHYEIMDKVGQGAYGVVWRAIQKRSGRIVVLKKVYGAFQNVTDAQRTFREISFLTNLKHKNVVALLAGHRGENEMDVYLVFEAMESDMDQVCHAPILREIHHRFIFWQILCALKYIHSAGIIHRDLKPSNLLVNADATVKLCDFGLGRLSRSDAPDEAEVKMTDYIGSRWYRSPEILLGGTSYTPAVDLWAAGCTLVEIITGQTMFPGGSSMEQLGLIVAFTGLPSAADLASVGGAPKALANVTFAKGVPLEERFPDMTPEARDIIRKLLVFGPKGRLTAEQALEHPYVQQFHSEEREPKAARRIQLELAETGARHPIRAYRQCVYGMVTALEGMSTRGKGGGSPG